MSHLDNIINRKAKGWRNITMKEFDRDIRELQMEYKCRKEESDWLIKIREDLSDIEFPPGVHEYAIAKPEGIYQMAMELKKQYNILKDGLNQIAEHKNTLYGAIAQSTLNKVKQ
ncbi:hypothetical protein NSS71_08265 [Niallia sp. FSL W8-0951]|uniref:hypothetical protein n=1 Tax=unclassified Niallia TaxID=2837522 RepID=UPI0030F78B80